MELDELISKIDSSKFAFVIKFELFASLIINSFMELKVLGLDYQLCWSEESSLIIMHSRCLVIFPNWELVAKS